MYKKVFSEYILNNGDSKASAIFCPDTVLPNIVVTTPFTFPLKDNSVYLCLDKMNWWNPLGGHIEKGESWKEALKRESIEEAGVEIKKIKLVGYILIKQLGKSKKYPPLSILPITTSLVKNYNDKWNKMETKKRGKFNFTEALELFKQRDDNNQMFEIFKYIINKY